ncbi:MAG TPA: hypothetical protein VFK36_15030 [Gemmatimonadales bacterium]|nr:hypothetical protein [Gemmatimonadales bacterium]
MAYHLEGYRTVLAAAKAAGAEFLPFSMQGPAQHVGRKTIYLRHDMDFSLEMAVRLAEVNAAEGVLATFFVLLRSPVYNLLSADTLPYLRDIRAMGQRLGLHVAVPAALPAGDAGLAGLVLADFATAQQQVGELDPVYAWHNTTPELLERGLALRVEGLVSAYSVPYFRDIPYYSDTGMRRTSEEWHDVVRSVEGPMQLLFHPELWVGGGASPSVALGRTWRYVIREREVEFLRNREYERDFPGGVADEFVHDLVTRIEAAAALPGASAGA